MSKAKLHVEELATIRGAWVEGDGYMIASIAEHGGFPGPYVVFYGPSKRKPLLAINVTAEGEYMVQFSGPDFPSTAKTVPLADLIRAAERAGLVDAAPACDCPCHKPEP